MSEVKQTFQTKYGNITCYKNDVEFYKVLSSGKVYEEDMIVTNIIPLLTNDNEEKVILDIGGHIGSHSLIYSKLVNCKIHAFEPQKKIYELLKMNVENNNLTNCEINNCAVGHKETVTTLSNMIYDGYDCEVEYDISKPLNYGGLGLGKNGEEVKMITVDSLQLLKCDYIKMDVEGAEILVLMGATETINKFKPLIWFESTDKKVSSEMKESMGIDFELEDVPQYLHNNYGYRFYKLDDYNILGFANNKRTIPIDLSTKEKTVYSESGEDGILFALLNTFGVTNKFYVEFGAEDGIQCNTHALREYGGFDGVLFDLIHENLNINLFRKTITADNVVDTFNLHNVPKVFDVLSLDIDSYDFYVLHAMLKEFQPRIFVCEYNATHLANEDKVVLKSATNFNGNYFGASILSFYKLAKKYNYSLVYANEKGVNLFFIHNDLLENTIFTIKDINDVEKIYRTPKYGKGPNGGHPPDIYNQAYITADVILE